MPAGALRALLRGAVTPLRNNESLTTFVQGPETTAPADLNFEELVVRMHQNVQLNM